MRIFGIYANHSKDRDYKAARMLEEELKTRGIRYYMDEELAATEGASNHVAREDVDVLFVVGGDGTMLGAARRFAGFGTELIGINMGTVGFLYELGPEGIPQAIDRLLAGKYHVEERFMLSACVVGKNGEETSQLALNDIVIKGKDPVQILTVDVRINGQHIDRMQCDGVVVSTPTGSTGYSLSAGGAVAMPEMEVMLVTPVCVHSLYSHNMLVDAHSTVELYPTGNSKRSCVLVADGQDMRELAPGEYIRVQGAPCKAKLIRLTDRPFFELLRDKLAE